MQVCSINELRNMISEEEFKELYENLKSKLEASIEFTEEDINKDLEQLEKEREIKLENLINTVKIKIDKNFFSNTINIEIDEINYKTHINAKKTEINHQLANENSKNTEKAVDDNTKSIVSE